MSHSPDETEQSQGRHDSDEQIGVPSFSSFRKRLSSIPMPSSPAAIRRKPVPDQPSSRAVSFSYIASPAQPHDAELRVRPFSIASPLPQQQTDDLADVTAPLVAAKPQQDTRTPPYQHPLPVSSIDSFPHNIVQRPSIPVPLRYDNDTRPGHTFSPSISSTTSIPTSLDRDDSFTMSVPVQAPAMTVQLDGIPRSFTDESTDSYISSSSPKRSRSPGGKLTSFFGWKSSSPRLSRGRSPDTSFSDLSRSPDHSRSLSNMDATPTNMGLTPPALDTHRANESNHFGVPGTPFYSHSPSVNAHVEELERELRQVSSELAGSIKREMELEDEVDRYRMEMPTLGHELSRRTSDYFSDSGTSSLRYPLGDSDAKIEELERMKRKAEQERAQLQVNYAQKLAEELRLRKDLESQIHELETGLQEKQGSDPAEEEGKDNKVRELESYLEETRRRLSQERQSKDNFDDLFAALREESETNRNERDNLRDEIVPSLRARVEGLESEASETQQLRYENTRMQQEIQALRIEIQMLKEAQDSTNVEFHENTFAPPRFPNTSRSNSLARSPSVSNLRRSNSLARSGSVKERNETRQRSDSVSGDRVKDVEDQRDALHSALKNLLRRHEGEKREHAKALSKLMADRDRARETTRGRTPYTREVNLVRYEIGQLRRRADDALEQKWQCENNIGGVKMALDRAQQETQSLREYLNGRTSPVKSTFSGLGIEIVEEENVELGDEDRKTMIRLLRQSITLAETERDAALREAEAYRQQANMLQQSDDEDLDNENELADQLLDSASRMEELAAQVQKHLQANLELRERLGQAVGKGEKQQSDSTARIVGMQSRLKMMEESVVEAQQQTEMALVGHEEEAKQIDEANSPKLQRLNVVATPAAASMHASPLFGVKSPKMGTTSSGKAENLYEVSKTLTLEQRVRELEAALLEADGEMQEVVQRINSSQYEIAELQGERDNAQRQMRRLQTQISDEKEKTQALLKV